MNGFQKMQESLQCYRRWRLKNTVPAGIDLMGNDIVCAATPMAMKQVNNITGGESIIHEYL
jgi:hypothetical protein